MKEPLYHSDPPVSCEERLKKFRAALEFLEEDVNATLGEADIAHLKKVERRGRLFSLLGYLTCWILPNPITAFCLSFGQFTRWLLAHHILHRGYDKVPGIEPKYTSKQFARGWRRCIDWFDWIHPEAWDYEHNILHHYHTSEDADPDVVERHTDLLRTAPLPVPIKYLLLFFVSITWKFTYYAPNTMSVLDMNSMKRIRHEHIAYITFKNIFMFRNAHVRKLWTSCYFPYGFFHFIGIPLLFAPLGKFAVLSVFLNKLLAECITNFHSFLVIGPNHTGEDLPKLAYHYKNKEEFFVNQILTSVNYRCGTEFLDHSQIWLNYQIEHHLFPALPMLRYRELQPKVKALCEEHGIPYIQESIWKRFRKMCAVCVGTASMPTRQAPSDLLSSSDSRS